MSIAPKRQLSQNFLTDQTIAGKIVDSLGITAEDEVLEIGPGTGALTRWIAESSARRIVAVDLDQRAIEHCMAQPWSAKNRVEYIQSDVRSIDPGTIFKGKRGLLIGNLPYGISSDLLFWILEHRPHLKSCVIMLQREVARRLVARPGSKDYGILSVAVWQGAQAKILFNVNPGSFFPRPQVVSAVVGLQILENSPVDVDFKTFQVFVRAAFSQRRKVMSNALKAWAGQRRISLVDEVVQLEKARTEELLPEQLAHLFLRLTRQV
jgi:16S rRNA (adenine1518-N6/adenine1519-N6)-dimethyltransferase